MLIWKSNVKPASDNDCASMTRHEVFPSEVHYIYRDFGTSGGRLCIIKHDWRTGLFQIGLPHDIQMPYLDAVLAMAADAKRILPNP